METKFILQELINYAEALTSNIGALWQTIGALRKNLCFDDLAPKHKKITKQLTSATINEQCKPEGEKLALLNIKGISVDRKQRKDGRFQARFTTPDGKQHSVYGRTREEAQQKALMGYKGRKRKKRETAKVLTFAEWYEKWIDLYKRPKLRPNTLKTYNYTSGNTYCRV